MAEEQPPVLDNVRDHYRPRIVDAKVSEKLSAFGGVLLTGPRSCGKSWTGLNHSNSAFFMGDEDSNRFAELNPQSALGGEFPHLVDEWQDIPKLWDIAKKNIDLNHRKGMYIFTGSSIPPLESTYHTGIGRFARLQMRTMSLFESGDSSGSVGLSSIFDTGKADRAPSYMDYPQAVRLICRGGWPEALGTDDATAIGMSYDYISSILDLDMSRVDGRRRSKTITKLVLNSLARNNATLASIPVIAADIREGGTDISDATVRNYVDILKKIFIIDEQDAWHPSLRSRSRVRTSPKRHFIDPSLAAAALKAGPNILLKDTRTTGFLFESLCYRDLSVYASALGGQVLHYRDNSGLEVDAVVQLDDGRWGAVEAKLGSFEFDKAASNLIRMKNKIMEAGAEEPSFLMILSATGGGAHTRPDGVAEVPIDCLGP